MFTLSQTSRVLGHARLSPGLECTGLSSPHPSPPYSRNIRVTKTIAQTMFPSSSAVPPMNSHRTLAIQISHRHCDAVLGRDAQQQVNVVRQGIALQKFDPLLPTKLPKNSSNFSACTSKKLSLPVFWQNHHVVLAVPPHMGLATPIFHLDPPRPSGPSSGEDLFTFSQVTAEPVQFSPPEAVD